MYVLEQTCLASKHTNFYFNLIPNCKETSSYAVYLWEVKILDNLTDVTLKRRDRFSNMCVVQRAAI